MAVSLPYDIEADIQKLFLDEGLIVGATKPKQAVVAEDTKRWVVLNAAGDGFELGISDDSLQMLLAGVQTVTGAKTFNAAVQLNSTLRLGATTAVSGILDEDNMASDSSVHLATQQSIKAYVDANISTPGGNTTQVQFNNAGAFDGDAGFTYDGAGSIALTGGASSTVRIETVSGGESRINFINGDSGYSWFVGVDAADSNKLKIAINDITSPTNVAMELGTTGDVSFPNGTVAIAENLTVAYNASGVSLFSDAAIGEVGILAITGWKAAGSVDTLNISVGSDIDQAATFGGCTGGYYFDNKLVVTDYNITGQAAIEVVGESGTYLRFQNATAVSDKFLAGTQMSVNNANNYWDNLSINVQSVAGGTSINGKSYGSAFSNLIRTRNSTDDVQYGMDVQIGVAPTADDWESVAKVDVYATNENDGHWRWYTRGAGDSAPELRMELKPLGDFSLYTPNSIASQSVDFEWTNDNLDISLLSTGTITIHATALNLTCGSGDMTLTPSGGNLVVTESVKIPTGKGYYVNSIQVVGAQQTALTTQLTSITHTSPGTPDYAIQNLTNTSPYGFVSQDEGNTVLSVILNLQTRVGELETKLKAHGLIA